MADYDLDAHLTLHFVNNCTGWQITSAIDNDSKLQLLHYH